LGILDSVSLSMGLLQIASRSIPMGTAYAVWGGIGALGTVLVGIGWFGEPLGALRILLLLGLIFCIVGLRLAAG
jgi:quaternary ammonium compound-resistance protein SugE